MKNTGWASLCFASIITLNTTPAFSTTNQTIPVYGAKQGASLQEKNPANRYVLQLGSYRMEQNALTYKALISKKTSSPVHIKKHFGIYYVYIGPIDNLNALHHISHQLLGERTVIHKAVSRKSIPHKASRSPVIRQQQVIDKDQSIAAPVSASSSHPSWSPVFTVSISPAWTTAGTSQTFYLQPRLRNTYEPSHDSNLFADGEIFLGMQHTFANRPLSAQFGLALAATNNTSASGDIWDDANPDFNNFTYNYQVSHRHVAVKGKLLTNNGYIVNPYISGSLGVGMNKASGFTITPKLFEEVAAPPFNSQNTTAFTYTAGVGFQRAVNEHLQLGLGYEFADWGKYGFAAADGQTVNSGLSQSNLYTNALQISLSYIK